MKKGHSAVLSCVGAVIGAGFASGREVVAFFTKYGSHGWWLIGLASLMMAGICALCMQAARTDGGEWMRLIRKGWLAKCCPLLMMMLTAGAMISASGHMVMLLWSHPQAYALGISGTLLTAWLLGRGRLKVLNGLSAALALMLLCALMGALVMLPPAAVALNERCGAAALAIAAIRAAGYASMNMMLAIGVVCRNAEYAANHWVTAGLFGWITGVLLLISQCVYSRYANATQMAFPLLALLNVYGRTGYLAGVILLYMAIVTSLASVLYALRTAVESCIVHRDLRWLLVLGVPLAVSGVGFEDIVDRLYAPAGLVCFFVVFAPLTLRVIKRSGPTFP